LKVTKRKIQPLDLIVLALLVAAALYTADRIRTQLNYHWDWSVIPQYLFRYNQETGSWTPNLLIQGLITTIRLSLWSTILAAFIGLVMGLCRISQSLFKRMLGRAYVEAIRNLPPLVLVFLFYYFVSDQIMPLLGLDDFIRSRSSTTQAVLTYLVAPPSQFTAFISAILTLALYEGAYITEIVRAGIESVEKGQWEAAHALGLSWWQQMRFVVLPQAIQRSIPPMAGQFISTIKDSAIVSVISIQELTFQGLQLMAATYLTFEIWTTIAVLYMILTLTCSVLARRLELYMQRGLT